MNYHNAMRIKVQIHRQGGRGWLYYPVFEYIFVTHVANYKFETAEEAQLATLAICSHSKYKVKQFWRGKRSHVTVSKMTTLLWPTAN